MSDLRSALEALADEMDATTYRTGMDMLTAPPPRRIRAWAERIRDLLASHEEREGEDTLEKVLAKVAREKGEEWPPTLDTWLGFRLADLLDLRGYIEEDPHGERVADMLDHLEVRCRSLARRLRSHADRDPEIMWLNTKPAQGRHAEPMYAVWEDSWVSDGLEHLREEPGWERVEVRRIGPSVEPEEETDV